MFPHGTRKEYYSVLPVSPMYILVHNKALFNEGLFYCPHARHKEGGGRDVDQAL